MKYKTISVRLDKLTWRKLWMLQHQHLEIDESWKLSGIAWEKAK